MNSSLQAGGNNFMENKTTTELLNLLTKLVDKDGNLLDGWQDAYDELTTRMPFSEILTNEFSGGESLQEKVEELEDEIKRLKRHKHDDKSGDVLIRI